MLRLALSLKKKHESHGLAAALTSQRAALHQGYGDALSPLSPVNPTDDATGNDDARVRTAADNNDNNNNNNQQQHLDPSLSVEDRKSVV